MAVHESVTITNGRYRIKLGDIEEMVLGWNEEGRSESMETGRFLDKLEGGYQVTNSCTWRKSLFHLDLARAKVLRDLLDEYIAYKEARE